MKMIWCRRLALCAIALVGAVVPDPAGLAGCGRSVAPAAGRGGGGAGRWEGKHAFEPSRLRFETGRLYRLVLRNNSRDPHYFTSDEFVARIFTRKVQVTQRGDDGRETTLAEFKGSIREIEVYPGHAAEWWFVPVATGKATDLHCGIVGSDGRTHAEHGMVGEIIIE